MYQNVWRMYRKHIYIESINMMPHSDFKFVYNKVAKFIELYLSTNNYFLNHLSMFLKTVKIINCSIQNVCKVDDFCRVWLQLRTLFINTDE